MRTALFISQVYVPDVASVGQHVADAAEEMVRRGWKVVVFTADSGYEDPGAKYPRQSIIHGVEVRRYRWSSTGKRSLLIRLAGQMSFVFQCVLAGLFTRGVECLVITTIPQLSGLAAIPLCLMRRLALVYWVMDLNPDQAVELGQFRRGSFPVRLFDWLNRAILRRATAVVALDRFMAERLERKAAVSGKLRVLAPWPHEDNLVTVPKDQNPFVRQQHLDGKLVFMYSGNHSIAHPLGTFLEAIVRLSDDPRLVFLFVGGGLRKREVESVIEQYCLSNMRSLPYQRLSEIRFSLSAANVHMVSMGNEMIGCVHPCKAYAAMALGKPILYLGPKESHIAELVAEYRIGWIVEHGQVDRMVETIEQVAAAEDGHLAEMGARARQLAESRFSKTLLCGAICETIEEAAGASKDRAY